MVIIICVILMSVAFSDELETGVKKKMIYSGFLSPGLFTTFGFGIGSVSLNQKTEKMIITHAGLGPMFLGGGVYFQKRFFKDSTRTGLFYTFDFGADVITVCAADPGGGGGDCSPLLVPNIAGGIGYSKAIGNNSYFRISLDLGIKALISNLNLSITF